MIKKQKKSIKEDLILLLKKSKINFIIKTKNILQTKSKCFKTCLEKNLIMKQEKVLKCIQVFKSIQKKIKLKIGTKNANNVNQKKFTFS